MYFPDDGTEKSENLPQFKRSNPRDHSFHKEYLGVYAGKGTCESGDFIQIGRDNFTTDDFGGNLSDFSYIIHPEKAHAGNIVMDRLFLKVRMNR